MSGFDSYLRNIAANGFDLVHGVFTSVQIEHMLAALEKSLNQESQANSILANSGGVYAARNVLTLWPGAIEAWQQPPLPEILVALLGPKAGLVRGLFFDKPPERSWGLPWHKDLTIAVRDNRLGGALFSKPTVKAGVPHVEAPREVLEQMLTMRIHLDEVTQENGPLKVLPGSHRDGKKHAMETVNPLSILASRGDVLLMRPLLTHGSNHSAPGTFSHRRILHLEFAASPKLPDGYCWFDFHPI